MKKFIYIFFGIITIIVVISILRKTDINVTSKQETIAHQPSWSSEKQQIIDQLKTDYDFVIEEQNKDVYIPPIYWTSIDFKKKESLSALLAEYCEYKDSKGVTYVNLLDKMSGKKLGKWTSYNGLEVE
jgi:hypothetical protein